MGTRREDQNELSPFVSINFGDESFVRGKECNILKILNKYYLLLLLLSLSLLLLLLLLL